MNWKNRLKNYNFWISIFSAVLLILQALKIEFDLLYVNEIYTAVLGLLVVIGIINDPTKTMTKTTDAVQIKTQETISQQQKEESVVNEKITDNKEQTMPINDENEADVDNFKNDLQTLLTTIATDLNNKIKEMEDKNIDALNKINVKIEKLNTETEQVINNNNGDNKQNIIPTVVEEANPYIDTIN